MDGVLIETAFHRSLSHFAFKHKCVHMHAYVTYQKLIFLMFESCVLFPSRHFDALCFVTPAQSNFTAWRLHVRRIRNATALHCIVLLRSAFRHLKIQHSQV